MTTVGYARVSSIGQDLAVQRDKLDRYWASTSFALHRIRRDRHSMRATGLTAPMRLWGGAART
jgi:DNA invertase Pin-like site-specific DNA recombinase